MLTFESQISYFIVNISYLLTLDFDGLVGGGPPNQCIIVNIFMLTFSVNIGPAALGVNTPRTAIPMLTLNVNTKTQVNTNPYTTDITLKLAVDNKNNRLKFLSVVHKWKKIYFQAVQH